MLGLWAKPKHQCFTVETVSFTEDLQRSGPALKRQVPGHPELFDHISETELLSSTSMRPLHQVTLDMEHVFLAKAWRLAKKYCEVRGMSAFIADALVCHVSATQRKKLKTAVGAACHPRLLYRVPTTRKQSMSGVRV